jgi:hypothetical protein
MTISAIELQEFGTVRVGLVAADSRELTNVSIGRDYLQGVLEDGQSIGIFRLSEITRIEFLETGHQANQQISYSRKTLSEQIQKLQVPCLAKLRAKQQPSVVETHWLLGLAKGFLIFEGSPNYLVPLASVGFIELGCG